MSFTGNVTCVIGKDLAASIGKKGTASDITLYNHKGGDTVLSFVEPSAYPEKIQSLVSALNMSDQVLFKVDEINAYFAETLVTLEAANISRGFLIFGPNIAAENLKAFLSKSIVSTYKVIADPQVVALRDTLAEYAPSTEGRVVAQVDHSFAVKGVGTVSLGVVKKGVLKKHDKLNLFPQKTSAMIKSIQVQDHDLPEAAAGLRFGAAIKDLSPDDISRGTIMSSGEVRVADELEIDATLSKYSARGLKEGDVFIFNSCLNYVPARVIGGAVAPGETKKIKVKLDKPVPLLPGRAIFLDPGQKMPRVFGYADV